MKLQSLLESIKEAAPKDSIYGIFVNGKDSTARFSDYAQASDLMKKLKKKNPKNDYEVKQADPKRISEGEERDIIQHKCIEKLQNYFSGREFEYESKDDLEYDIYQALEKLDVKNCVDPKMIVGGQPIGNFADPDSRVIDIISASDVIYDVMNALDLSQLRQPVEENIFQAGALAAMLGMSASAMANDADVVSRINNGIEKQIAKYEANPDPVGRHQFELDISQAAYKSISPDGGRIGNSELDKLLRKYKLDAKDMKLYNNLLKLFTASNDDLSKIRAYREKTGKGGPGSINKQWSRRLEDRSAEFSAKLLLLSVLQQEERNEDKFVDKKGLVGQGMPYGTEVKENLNDDMIGQPDDYYDEEERKEAYADLQDALDGVRKGHEEEGVIDGICPACGGNGYMDGEEEVYNDETDDYEEGTECDGFGRYGCDQGEMTGASWVEIIKQDKRNAERQKAKDNYPGDEEVVKQIARAVKNLDDPRQMFQYLQADYPFMGRGKRSELIAKGMKMADVIGESFKHYQVKHKKSGKMYKVTAMHDNSAKEKARAQHGGTASRYSGTSVDDFEIVEGKSPHKKGSAKYKKHMAAKHAAMGEAMEKKMISIQTSVGLMPAYSDHSPLSAKDYHDWTMKTDKNPPKPNIISQRYGIYLDDFKRYAVESIQVGDEIMIETAEGEGIVVPVLHVIDENILVGWDEIAEDIFTEQDRQIAELKKLAGIEENLVPFEKPDDVNKAIKDIQQNGLPMSAKFVNWCKENKCDFSINFMKEPKEMKKAAIAKIRFEKETGYGTGGEILNQKPPKQQELPFKPRDPEQQELDFDEDLDEAEDWDDSDPFNKESDKWFYSVVSDDENTQYEEWMTAFANCVPGSKECDVLLTHEHFRNMLADGPLDEFNDLFLAYNKGKADDNMIKKYQALAKNKLGESVTNEAEYRGRKVKLNKPTRGDVKKFKVYVKDPKTGNIKKVNFGHGGSSAKKAGQKTMKIKKSNPKRRKSFRARHNCDNPGPKTKARYWSCRKW